MERWQNCIAVVTGISSGIGAAIAKELVHAGLIVAGLARRKEKVDELRATLAPQLQARLHSVRCDVSDVQSVNAAFDWIEANLGGVDILVNNAGMHSPGLLVTLDVAKLQQVLQTNVMGVVHCTQRAFRSMQARKFAGHVVIINSVIGHHIVNMPGGAINDFNIYGPSKYAITGMTEMLRQEFRDCGTQIKVTSISPGLVNTAIVPEQIKQKLVMLQPQDVAQGVLYAISTPPHVQVHELTIKPVGELL